MCYNNLRHSIVFNLFILKNKIELNKIYNESCIDTLKRIPDDYVDLVITSPPYNINLRIRKGEYCSRQIVKEISRNDYYNTHNIPKCINIFYSLYLPFSLLFA